MMRVAFLIGRSVRKFLSVRTFMFVVIVYLVMEVVAYSAPYVVGKQVHSKYLHLNTDYGIWAINERGARGSLYRGQDFQAAVFGSSTSIGFRLDQKDSWPEKLKTAMRPKDVHVDNFSHNGAHGQVAKIILDNFYKQGRRYDLILLMVFSENWSWKKEINESHAFRFWGNWVVESKSLFRVPGLLKKQIIAQLEISVRAAKYAFEVRLLNKLLNRLTRWRFDAGLDKDLLDQLREMGSKGKIVYVPFNPDEKMVKKIQSDARSLFLSAKKVSDNVFFITHPIAYDLHEHPGVAKKWFHTSQIPKSEAEQLCKGKCYYDNKALAEKIRGEQTIMAKVARSMDVGVIDLDSFMRTKIRETDDLFMDQWHVTPKGAKLAADFVLENIKITF